MSSVLFDEPGPRARARHLVITVLSVLVVGGLLGWMIWKLWEAEQITPEEWEPYTQSQIIEGLAEGLLETLKTAAVAILLSLAFGAVFASARLSDRRWIRFPAVVVVEFFRAVPLLLLIFYLFLTFTETLGRFWALVIALMLYNGSVLAEVFRAGIQAVPRGQSEAAYAVGMRKSQVMTLVLGPQAVRAMLPAIISQCVVALKDTTLGFIIGADSIVKVADRVSIFYHNPIATAIVLAVVFIIINYSLSRLAIYLEGRLRREGKAVVAPPGAAPAAMEG